MKKLLSIILLLCISLLVSLYLFSQETNEYRLVKMTINYDNKEDSVFEYKYDNMNRIIEENISGTLGSISDLTLYSYNKQDELESKTYFSGEEYIGETKFKYDKEGRLINEEEFFSDSIEDSYITHSIDYHYNNDGLLVK